MNLHDIANSYGYAIVLIGTFFEGETILVLGGVAAKLDYMKLPWVMAAAFAGSLCGDQLFFYLGRFYGPGLLAKKPRWAEKAQHVYSLYYRFETVVLLGFRFAYGLRWATPFALGAGKVVTPIKFLLFNAISALIWSVAVGSFGYALGQGAELVLGDIKHYEMELMIGVALISLVVWLWRRFI